MRDFLTKKMYKTRALLFAIGVMTLSFSPIITPTSHAAKEQKWIFYLINFY